jgi:hypothetical protein
MRAKEKQLEHAHGPDDQQQASGVVNDIRFPSR